MKTYLRKGLLIWLAVILFAVSCATTKTLSVWKDEAQARKLGKTLLICLAENDNIRNHFENVLAQRLGARGIDAVPSNKVIPQLGDKSARETIVSKVREMGIVNVLVARSVSKEEQSRITPKGQYFVPADYYGYPFHSDNYTLISVPGSSYEAEFFTIVTNIYDAHSEKLVWSYLSRVKVETSRQGAVNPFLDTLMSQLESSKML